MGKRLIILKILKILNKSLNSDKAFVIDARIDPDAYQDNFGGTIGD